MKKEFIFQIERDEDALVAICYDPEMATQGGSLDELIAMIRDLSNAGLRRTTSGCTGPSACTSWTIPFYPSSRRETAARPFRR